MALPNINVTAKIITDTKIRFTVSAKVNGYVAIGFPTTPAYSPVGVFLFFICSSISFRLFLAAA